MTPDQIAYLAQLRSEMKLGKAIEVTIPAGESLELQFAFQLPWEEGCWIATAEMAWPPSKEDRAYLPPGEHVVQLRIGFKDATGRSYAQQTQLKIFSPALGKTMRVQEMKTRPRKKGPRWAFWR